MDLSELSEFYRCMCVSMYKIICFERAIVQSTPISFNAVQWVHIDSVQGTSAQFNLTEYYRLL